MEMVCLQHKEVVGDAVSLFRARVDSHDCNLYILSPKFCTESPLQNVKGSI